MGKEKVETKTEPQNITGIMKRKTLAELFYEPIAIKMDRAQMHQAFQIPGGTVESTISGHRLGTKGMELVYHPGYGLIGLLKGKFFLSPSANVIVAHE